MVNQICFTDKSCDELSCLHEKVNQCSSAMDGNDLTTPEWFVVLMFDVSSDITTVNEAKLSRLSRKQIRYDSTPQTQAVGILNEHARYSSYEARHVSWGRH